MASKTVTVCDHPEDVDRDVRAEERREFVWGGVEYELDLCRAHDAQFGTFLEAAENWASMSRRKSPERPRKPPHDTRSAGHRQENARIRRWATEQGRPIGNRGRIPEALREEFRRWLETDAGRRWAASLRGLQEETDEMAESTPFALANGATHG